MTNSMTFTAPDTLIIFCDGIEAPKIVERQFRQHFAEVARVKAEKEAAEKNS